MTVTDRDVETGGTHGDPLAYRTARKRLVLAIGAPAPLREALEEIRPQLNGFEVVAVDDPGPDLLARAEVIAGLLDRRQLAQAASLRWNHLWTAGAERALARETAERGILLSCSAGNGAVPLAEHAMMLLLMLAREAPRLVHAQDARRWAPFSHAELAGKSVAIVGLGNVGRALAVRCHAFDLRVLGIRHRPERGAPPGVDEVFGTAELCEAFSRSDFVVVTAPLTARTRAMVGAEQLRALRPGAFLVNVSRGEVVDQDALLDALRHGRIAGAGLDAHTTEPLAPDSEWWSAPNAIITPHLGSVTAQTDERTIRIFVDNLTRYARGRPLINTVALELGYSESAEEAAHSEEPL